MSDFCLFILIIGNTLWRLAGSPWRAYATGSALPRPFYIYSDFNNANFALFYFYFYLIILNIKINEL